MNLQLKQQFLELWEKHFGIAELPMTFYYHHEVNNAQLVERPKGWRCIIGELANVRKGKSLAYKGDSITCLGAKRYMGYAETIRPNFNHFLSCGIPGELEGERYIRTPEMVGELMEILKPIEGVKDKYIIFKRWDMLDENDQPDAVLFFATPDVLSGLFTLANYDQSEPNTTIAPFGSGCASIVYYPYLEKFKERQRAIIGMFDPSARPYVPKDTLSFAVPMAKFEKMIGYMDESFLITDTWVKMRKRIQGA